MIPTFQLPTLSVRQKSLMLKHASCVLQAHQQMNEQYTGNIVQYTLQQHERHLSMDHYPKGDRIDHDTGSQYFYHCHRENFDSMEHGHFHCFLRYRHISPKIKALMMPEDESYASLMTHIIAIAMNCQGQPIRLFTVNQWVSSEVWYEAKHISKFINAYKITLNDDPYWQLLDQWIDGMIHLFAPQIIWLHRQRDHYLAQQQLQHPDKNVYMDDNIEEVSSIGIDLTQQIQWLINADNITVSHSETVANL